METKTSFIQKLLKPVEASSLAFFRIAFGMMMAISLARFFSMGWIEQFYLHPKFHFTYFGFSWVKPLGEFTYVLFAFCFLSALMIAIGFFYRFFVIGFFLSFTYLELIEKSTYLNHYYFVSLMSFVLIFLPAHTYFSIDAFRNVYLRSKKIPFWSILTPKLLLAMVYFFAGLAKLNSDWLLEAQPLKIWLSNRSHYPVVGGLLRENWLHYAFSWSGAIFDLCVPFLLFWKKTHRMAYLLVVIFHLITAILFPIGMFPFIMIVSTLIFMDSDFHQKILGRISKILKLKRIKYPLNIFTHKMPLILFFLFFILMIFMPFRYLYYPGELFWHQQGFRFSWRVMLIEKTGFTEFRVKDAVSGSNIIVDNFNHLSPYQESQMATRPDMILEYAHYLGSYYQEKYQMKQPQVFVESFVSLNGRKRKRFIDPKCDLLKYHEGYGIKEFILPFNEKIYGF